jgi:hypothetical protein
MADKIQLPFEAPGSASEAAGSELVPMTGITSAIPYGFSALALGIPVYLAQRRHLTPPAPVPAYR